MNKAITDLRKSLLIIVLYFLFSALSAQQPPDFSAVEAAGIYTLDIEHAVKKLKTEDPKIDQSIREFLSEYNMEIYLLSDSHSKALSDLDEMFDRQLQIAMQRRDRSQMNGVKSKMKSIIPPIKLQVIAYETKLNDSMQSILNEKQFHKWLKYQKSKRPPEPQIGN